MVKEKNAYKKIYLASLIAGIIFGAFFYSIFKLKWLYQIDGQYFTFTQPRATQAIAKLYQFNPNEDKNCLYFIIFGGSSAYHAINDEVLASMLMKKLNRPVKVALVSYPYTTLFETLTLLSALPQARYNNAYVIDTWSFWKLTGDAFAQAQATLSYNRSLFLDNKHVINMLQKGEIVSEYVPRIHQNSSLHYDNWQSFLKGENLPKSNTIFTTWVKYFLLDKLLKINRSDFKHLFKDYVQISPEEDLSEEAIENYIKLLKEPAMKQAIAENKASLISSFDKDYRDVSINLDKIIGFNLFLLKKSAELTQNKGYKFVVLELPIANASYKSTNIANFIHEFRRSLDGTLPSTEHINYQPIENLDNNEYAWWDLVHTTIIGKKIYLNKLSDYLADLASKEYT